MFAKIPKENIRNPLPLLSFDFQALHKYNIQHTNLFLGQLGGRILVLLVTALNLACLKHASMGCQHFVREPSNTLSPKLSSQKRWQCQK